MHVGNRRPCTRSESQRAKDGNSINLESVELIQQEAKGELIEVSNLYTDHSLDKAPSDHSCYFPNLGELFQEDIMSYPYSKYNDEADVEVHMRAFS